MEQIGLTFDISLGDERHRRQQQKRQDKALSQRLRAERKRKRVEQGQRRPRSSGKRSTWHG